MSRLDAGARRLRCGDDVAVRLETPASLAAAGWPLPVAPGRCAEVIALLWVAPSPPPGPGAPALALAAGATLCEGETLVAAGPAADGRHLAWIRIPVGAGALAELGGGAPASLRVRRGAGRPAADVALPAALVTALARELEDVAVGRAGG